MKANPLAILSGIALALVLVRPAVLAAAQRIRTEDSAITPSGAGQAPTP